MRAALRKPLKPAFAQLLAIPNRDAVFAEFKRCAPLTKLVNIELERYTLLSAGPILKLCAFIEKPKLTIEHVIYYRGRIDEADLIAGARILGQTAERQTFLHRRNKEIA